MEVTAKIPDVIVARAKAQGMREVYAQEILAQQAAASAPTESRPRSPEEVRAWFHSIVQFSDNILFLPKNVSREWPY